MLLIVFLQNSLLKLFLNFLSKQTLDLMLNIIRIHLRWNTILFLNFFGFASHTFLPKDSYSLWFPFAFYLSFEFFSFLSLLSFDLKYHDGILTLIIFLAKIHGYGDWIISKWALFFFLFFIFLFLGIFNLFRLNFFLYFRLRRIVCISGLNFVSYKLILENLLFIWILLSLNVI